MSSVKKRIEELDLMDDFLFTEATTDPEAAPLLLKIVAEQELDAAKQELDAAKQETDVIKKLTQILLNEERYDDLKRIITDEEYLKKMMTVYNIGLGDK